MTNAEPITLPAPVIEAIVPTPDKWALEHQAFRRQLPELLQRHPGQYVAVHGGQVVAWGPDKLAVALEAFRQVGNVPIHVGLVAEDPPAAARSGIRRVLPRSGAVL